MDEQDLKKWADPDEIEAQESGGSSQDPRPEVSASAASDRTDSDFADDTEVIISQPKTPVWKRNEIKLPVVTGVGLLVVFMGYAFMRGGQSHLQTQLQADQAQNSLPTGDPQTPAADPSASESAEVAKLKTQLALGTQSEEIAALNQEQNQAQSPPPASVVKPSAPTTATPAVSQPPARVTYAPPRPPINYSRYTTPVQPRVSAPPPPVRVAIPSPAPENLPADPPIQETTFVSYGRLPGVPNARGSSIVNRADNTGVIYTSDRQRPAPPQRSLAQQQTAFLSGDRYAQIPRGAKLKGQMQTPVIAEPGQEFLVEITQPVANIPQGSYATALIDQVYGDGLMQASIRGIVTPEGQRFMIPEGSMQVLASNGKPLVAKRMKGGPNVAKMIANVALGAISNATGTLNRPRTRFNAENGSVYEDYGDANLTAALLQGGVNSVLPMIQQQQAEIQEDLAGNQGTIRFLKAGTHVYLQAY
ncbi:hypothetical protein [Lyngbya confervoides]|uniref:Conjugal transfer protein TrbI n=1 Tax=Lyngbya confervoides BDU141951 TaxID=1574623 RepID=A0ABD4T8H7_9CYAN|nr:hypothetical protein [Lyngbya confervoides]MCM1985097.1 hypothetical protein [Lyngbya confervoides BDU141951]